MVLDRQVEAAARGFEQLRQQLAHTCSTHTARDEKLEQC
jgi:hypothetical protein